MRRGNALVTTLVWIALIMVLAFGLAGLTVSHLSTVSYQDNRQLARLLARSVTSTAIARIMYDTDFGKTDTPSGLLEVKEGEGVGQLTFESEVASEHDLPYSTNNLEETKSVSGAGGSSVPSNSVRLLGIGRVGGVTQRVECILAVPPFPYAIAASGSVEARGGLVIGSLKEMLQGPVPAGTTFLPADLLANGTGEQAVFLGQNTRISGDVRSGGTIVLDPSAPPDTIQVEGQLKSNSAPEKIPSIDLAHYDPQINGSQFTELKNAEYGDGQTKLGGISRREGDLTILEGLFIDGGTLFVDGNLTVRGGLTGKGVVVADGNVTLEGQTSFDATSGVAVLASRDLTVSGSDASGSYFQGLLYTEGGFTADKVTLVGCLVAGGDPNDVRLTDTRVLQPPPPEPGATATPPPPPAATPEKLRGRTSTKSGNTVWFDVDGPPGGPLTLTVTIEPPASNPTGPTVVSDPWSFTDWYPFKGTDPRARDWCLAHDMSADNLNGCLNSMDAMVVARLEAPPPPPQQSGTAISLLDPSSFLKLNERIRIVLWKED